MTLQVMGTSKKRPSPLRMIRRPLKWELVEGWSERSSAASSGPFIFLGEVSGCAANSNEAGASSVSATARPTILSGEMKFIFRAAPAESVRKCAGQNEL